MCQVKAMTYIVDVLVLARGGRSAMSGKPTF